MSGGDRHPPDGHHGPLAGRTGLHGARRVTGVRAETRVVTLVDPPLSRGAGHR